MHQQFDNMMRSSSPKVGLGRHTLNHHLQPSALLARIRTGNGPHLRGSGALGSCHLLGRAAEGSAGSEGERRAEQAEGRACTGEQSAQSAKGYLSARPAGSGIGDVYETYGLSSPPHRKHKAGTHLEDIPQQQQHGMTESLEGLPAISEGE